MSRLSSYLLGVLLTSTLAAQDAPPAFDWFPGSHYDPDVPAPREILGYEIGEDYTEHLQMTRYMRQLEQASSRVSVFSVGHSTERRELLLVAVSAPENIARLEEIRLDLARLRDPRTTSEQRAREIASTTPAVSWMNFANDGNESAAFETAIQLAYQLAAGQDDRTGEILRESITIIYPAHNPESHSRHVAWMKASATGNPDPQAQEHRRNWRMDNNNNHFQIDLNRDAVFLSQHESRIVVSQIHRWNPVVFVDFHGNPDTFFFPPWATPVNTHLDDNARKWVTLYGRNIAREFDQEGWVYFTRNVYDLHYPGYYDSYPSLNGATGMTCETDGGGNKGLVYRLPDGRITTLRDGILHHFRAALSTLLSTAQNRQQRLLDLYRFRASGMQEVREEKVKQYLLLPADNPHGAADLVELLLRHDIEVHRINEPWRSAAAHDYFSDEIQAREFAAGSYLIEAQQPQKRLLRTLLDRESPLEEVFLQQVRRDKAYNDGVGPSAPRKRLGFYDITAWSLPLAYGVEVYWTEDVFRGSRERLTSRPEPSLPSSGSARFAYLFEWNSAPATRVVSALWQQGYQVSLARERFLQAEQEFQAGTVVVKTRSNPESLHQVLPELADGNQLQLFRADSAYVDEGRDLGDRSVVDLKKPSIAVITEEPTTPTAYGAIWFMLEEMYQIPFTPLRAVDLMWADLGDYNVIVLPDGSPQGYDRYLAPSGAERLKNWVREGGTLVCLKGAAQWAAGEQAQLTTARVKKVFSEKAAAEGDPPEAQENGKPLSLVPGAMVTVRVDPRHYLGTAMPPSVVALLRSDFVFEPTKEGARVGSLDKDRPVLAGFAFEDSRKALQNAPFFWDEPTGRGHVICFADDVTFRTFLHAAHRLFLNAILLAPTGQW